MLPPSPYRQIDTLQVAKNRFGFSSNKLDALAGYFDIGHKDETDFELWKSVLEGNQDAINYMRKYNEKDVTILEEVYLKLRPWINSHPNVAMYELLGEGVCTLCGSEELEFVGNYYTNRNEFKTYRCKKCGGMSRESRGNKKNTKILAPIAT